MPHQFLNDLHILSVANKKRRKGVAKGMPPNFLVDPSSQCRWPNDLVQQRIWRERMLPLCMRACEYPVVGLPMRARLPPYPKIRGNMFVERHRLARCFRFAIANVSQINGARDIEAHVGEINIAPF